MDHLPKLIEDLALILIVAAVVTLLFKRLKQPLVLGYIIAGFFVGPHLSLFPTIADTENIETLAEIGVIFLLFSLGLEFNLKKILHVGTSATITALVEIVFITITGYALGKMLGWSTIDSIFLGGMLASSSTTIIIKAFDDMGLKTKHYVRVVFGVLVVEDIMVILLLVLLPTIAVAQQFAGVELLLTVLKLFFFLILMVVIGVFILPTFMKKAKSFLNDETLLVFSIGLCLGMVVLATNVGFSAELGAFIMGFILAESTSSDKIEHIIKPVKDLFAAVFFVSIGMMIDPEIILEYGWVVIAVTLLTIFGKLFSTVGGALISGQSLKQSIQVGMSMAQIGEFAFIVATLGLSLGVISDFLFPVAVGASAITTFTTPYMIKYSDRLSFHVANILPARWLNTLKNYSVSTNVIQSEKEWKKILKWYLSMIFINSIIIIALVLISNQFLIPFFSEIVDNNLLARIIGLITTISIIAPFLWGLMAKHPSNITHKEFWIKAKNNKVPLLFIELMRIIIGLFFIGYLINMFFHTIISILILVPIVFIVLIISSKQLNKFHQRLQDRFLFNLSTTTSVDDEISSTESLISNINLSSWDGHIVELEVEPHAVCVGQKLESLSWREKYGINIAYIKRGEELLYAPKKDNKLYPFDRIGIIATDEQLQTFNPVFEASEKMNFTTNAREDIAIQNIVINENSKLIGISLRSSGISEKANGLIIGIERNNKKILNPVSSTVFEKGDIIWVVGEREKIKELTRD